MFSKCNQVLLVLEIFYLALFTSQGFGTCANNKKKCIFPFKIDGEAFEDCTDKDGSNVCPTSLDWEDEGLDFADCLPSCPNVTSSSSSNTSVTSASSTAISSDELTSTTLSEGISTGSESNGNDTMKAPKSTTPSDDTSAKGTMNEFEERNFTRGINDNETEATTTKGSESNGNDTMKAPKSTTPSDDSSEGTKNEFEERNFTRGINDNETEATTPKGSESSINDVTEDSSSTTPSGGGSSNGSMNEFEERNFTRRMNDNDTGTTTPSGKNLEDESQSTENTNSSGNMSETSMTTTSDLAQESNSSNIDTNADALKKLNINNVKDFSSSINDKGHEEVHIVCQGECDIKNETRRRLLYGVPPFQYRKHFYAGSVSGSKVTWDDYMSYDTVLAFAQVLKKYFPTGVFIDILGQTLEGRDLFVVSLCSSGICGKKPGIWLDAGTHAREWTTISSLTYIMNELIQHRENHEKIVDALDWYFMPVVNPDGYEYSMTIDSNWRKNRAINPGCIGVDINRNFPVKWESGVCDDTFPGLKTFSEVESRLQADFIRKRSSCIKLFNSFHNYGDLILFPWAATNLDYASEASHIKLGQRGINAMSVRSGRDYKIGSVSKVLYLAKGSSMDYYANIGIPYVYTMEIGTSFIPDTKEIIPLAKEVFEFIKTLSKQIILDFA